MVQVLINSKGLNMNPMQSLYYVSPSCFVCLFLPFRESPAQPSRTVAAPGMGIILGIAMPEHSCVLCMGMVRSCALQPSECTQSCCHLD